MKSIALCISLFTLASFSHAQQQFIGKWDNKKEDGGCEYLEVKKKASVFNAVCNQLSLECNNIIKQDTLYLYVINSDTNRGFMGPRFFPPKPKSLFAKCYIQDSELKIIYTQKLFRDNIKVLDLQVTMPKVAGVPAEASFSGTRR